MYKKIILTGITLVSVLFNHLIMADNVSIVDNGDISFTENDVKFANSIINDGINTLFSGKKIPDDYEYRYITAQHLYKKYSENEAQADNYFKNKEIIISGNIKNINTYSFDNKVLISFSAGRFLDTVHAMLKEGFQDYALGLHKGQKITLACSDVGMIVGEPVVKNCIPEDQAKIQIAQLLIRQINKVINGDINESNKQGAAIVALTKSVDLSTDNFSICKKIDISCLKQSSSLKWKKLSAENREQIEQYKKILNYKNNTN
ncbi:MAG: OB-fold putative lipoprotein [Enterobacteriaceae bacterium]|jgi:hypothetical protein|nr:OB-fold putative lipoprotein [Enterobacteriaceae bacterium]